jgi:hypothetical protein
MGERGHKTYTVGTPVELASDLDHSFVLPEDESRIQLTKYCNFIIQTLEKVQNDNLT